MSTQVLMSAAVERGPATLMELDSWQNLLVADGFKGTALARALRWMKQNPTVARKLVSATQKARLEALKVYADGTLSQKKSVWIVRVTAVVMFVVLSLITKFYYNEHLFLTYRPQNPQDMWKGVPWAALVLACKTVHAFMVHLERDQFDILYSSEVCEDVKGSSS